MADYINLAGSIAALLIAGVGAFWGVVKIFKRAEHYPRVNLQLSCSVVGQRGPSVLCDLRASIDNKGNVPIRIKSFEFNLRGIKDGSDLQYGGAEIRNQASFSELIKEGSFIPENWDETFVHPNVKAEYDFALLVPANIRVIRAHAYFTYNDGKTHHQTQVIVIDGSTQKI